MYHIRWHGPAKSIPKALRDLLWHNRKVVAGVGMEAVAKNLEDQPKLKISSPKEVAEYQVMEFADQVLDGDLPWKKPDSMSWWEPREISVGG